VTLDRVKKIKKDAAAARAANSVRDLGREMFEVLKLGY
jgi:hypothetical protein